MATQQLTSSFVVTIDERPLPDAVQAVSAIVDQDVGEPDLFQLTFHDPQRTALAAIGARVGSKVAIVVQAADDPAPVPLVSGEVTALEVSFGPAGSLTTVRGYDESHRLVRGAVTASYRDVTVDDLVRTVARRAGLAVGTVESAGGPRAHVAQGNQSDWDFLRAQAASVGMELAVVDGKVNLRTPTRAATGPDATDLASEAPFALVVGANVLELEASITSSGQVTGVEVRGWDWLRKQPLSAEVPAGTARAQLSLRPAELAGEFGSPVLVGADRPLDADDEVRRAAEAYAEDVAQGYVDLHGTARGTPRLRAGTAVSLSLAGDPFDGRYVLTRTRHRLGHDGTYITEFDVTRPDRHSLLGLVSGRAADDAVIPGVVSALVDDVDDPEELCRVRVRFPWMSPDYVSGWARTVQAGAGKDRGATVLPEVGDEVLVAFEQGDVRFPVVVGGLHNGVDRPPAGAHRRIDRGTHAIDLRAFTSRHGHHLSFTDASDDDGVRLATGDGTVELHLDQSAGSLVISCGDLHIAATGSIQLDAGGDLTATARGSFQVSAAQVSIDASGPAAITGTPVRLN